MRPVTRKPWSPVMPVQAVEGLFYCEVELFSFESIILLEILKFMEVMIRKIE